MALADIIGRIESDAGAEARALTDGAKAKAEAIMTDARRAGDRLREHALRDARHDAESRAATLLANARLAARDEMLSGKRGLVERVLELAEERLVSLDDAAYARLIARGVLRAARGGDVIRIAAGEQVRLAGLPAAIQAAARESGSSLELHFSAEPVDIPHGVMVEADRVSAEVSPASMVSGRHDELTEFAAARLFPVEEA